jgi:hypothetical protein
MKNKYFIFAIMLLVVGIIYTGCGDNRENAKENVQQANQEMMDAQTEYDKEWKLFKTEAEAKISVNQKTIDDFKTAMVTTSSKFKAKYENQVLTLEQKNIELMKKLNDYQYKGKENWEEFKRGFNDDIYLVENSLKDIFAKKE